MSEDPSDFEHPDFQNVVFPPTHPRGHPLTPADARELAAILGIEPPPGFRLTLYMGFVDFGVRLMRPDARPRAVKAAMRQAFDRLAKGELQVYLGDDVAGVALRSALQAGGGPPPDAFAAIIERQIRLQDAAGELLVDPAFEIPHGRIDEVSRPLFDALMDAGDLAKAAGAAIEVPQTRDLPSPRNARRKNHHERNDGDRAGLRTPFLTFMRVFVDDCVERMAAVGAAANVDATAEWMRRLDNLSDLSDRALVDHWREAIRRKSAAL